MSLPLVATGAFLIAFLMGAAWAAPTTPSAGTQTKIERDSQMPNEQHIIKATSENNRTESAASTSRVDLTSEFAEEDECQNAWQKFMVDFKVQYSSDTETQKRRNIFCGNWKGIQEHNVQYEAGKVSHKKAINQWSDLTFEEWRKRQETSFPPNMEETGTYLGEPTMKPKSVLWTNLTFEEWKKTQETSFPPNMEEPGTYLAEPKMKATLVNGTLVEAEESGVNQESFKCQAAWKKFLTDFSRNYKNEAETEMRRSIFCDNWQWIQKHNVRYEAGKVSHKKGINQWTDLTFEEWRKRQETSFPPNMEEPGTYLGEPKMKATLVNGTLVEAEESEVNQERNKCQAAWKKFLTDFSRKYKNEAETERRRSIFCDNWQRIQEHNMQYETGKVSHKKGINQWTDLTFEEWKKTQETSFPPNMETPGLKTKATEREGNPETPRYTFPPNMEEPGTYLGEPTIKPKSVNEEHPVEVPTHSKEKKETVVEKAGTHLVKKEESDVNQESIKCQAAWEKFLTDYSRKYENDAETKIRRTIFCDNWQRIQEHNALCESGKVSQKESINEWSDLTSGELAAQSPDSLPPNLKPAEIKREIVQVGSQQNWFPPNEEEPGTYLGEPTMKSKSVSEEHPVEVPTHSKEKKETVVEKAGTHLVKKEESEVNQKSIKCQAAWEKFLTDYSRKYENDAETKIRRTIFCDNWQRIQEHNALCESGKVSQKESINEWSDLTSGELAAQSPDSLPPNLKPAEIKREIVQVGSQQNWFPPNEEEPGTYIIKRSLKSEIVNKELTDVVPLIEELEKPNKRNETIVEVGSQQNWFQANHESPGTYIGKLEPSEVDRKRIQCQAAWEKFLTDFSRTYENETETQKRRSIFCHNWQRIQEHNVQYEAGKVSHKKAINQWSDLTFAEWRKKESHKN